MADRNSFLLYKDMLCDIQKLNMEQRGMLLTAVLEYQNDIAVSIDDPLADLLFGVWCRTFDRDADKYRVKCEKRREAGRKGGYAKAENAKKDLANVANASFARDDLANVADTDTDTDTESDTDTVTDTDSDSDGDINKAAGAAAGRLMVEYMQLINCTPSPVATEGILKAVEELGEDVVHLAVCQTADSGNRSWNYLRSILERCRMDGINSRERWDEKERVREERKRIRSGAGSSAPEAAEPKIIRDDIGEMLKNGILI